MKHKCPYCGKPMATDTEFPGMTARMLRVYRTVAGAGPNGIMSADLLARMYDDEEDPTPGGGVVLRVQIHYINQILSHVNQKIVGKKSRGYRLTTAEGEK